MGVFEDQRDTLVRVGRVNGQIRPPGDQGGKNADDRFRVAVAGYPDNIAASYLVIRDQLACKCCREFVERTIGQMIVIGGQCSPVRVVLNAFPEYRDNCRVAARGLWRDVFRGACLGLSD